MTAHEQFEEDIVRFALGELAGGDCEAFRAHLSECPSCREELAEVQEAIGVYSLTALGPAPPARSRARLMQAIAGPPPKVSRISRPRWMFVPALASVFLAVIAIVLVGDNFRLREELTARNDADKATQVRLARAEMIAETITATDAVQVSLTAPKTKQQPDCKVFYLQRRDTLVLMASNLESLPEAETYELWAIPPRSAAIPAGTFVPDSRGGAAMVTQMTIPQNLAAKTFAITVEPKGGSPQPTSTPMMVGS